MNHTANLLIQKSLHWLERDVFPLWIEHGIDRRNGGFIENLTFEGTAQDVPRRAMVQARQIYSFVTGAQMGCLSPSEAGLIVERAAQFFEKSYLQPTGECWHAVHADGSPFQKATELYTQAFALFALAKIQEIRPQEKWKNLALNLTDYLHRARRNPQGGYTEIKEGHTLFQSNPHMHLFEAALAWIAVDPQEQKWRTLAQELFDLASRKFIQADSGGLAEHFDSKWQPEQTEGRYILEPGHHFEWAWLLSVHQNLTGVDSRTLRHRLRAIGELYGVDPMSHLTYDEIWSDFSIRKKSSRFWPHCERVKAAVKLGLEVPPSEQSLFAKQADEAMTNIFKYLGTPRPGLWYDTLQENGQFNAQPPKASSLYHIINAMLEYTKLRPKIADL